MGHDNIRYPTVNTPHKQEGTDTDMLRSQNPFFVDARSAALRKPGPLVQVSFIVSRALGPAHSLTALAIRRFKVSEFGLEVTFHYNLSGIAKQKFKNN